MNPAEDDTGPAGRQPQYQPATRLAWFALCRCRASRTSRASRRSGYRQRKGGRTQTEGKVVLDDKLNHPRGLGTADLCRRGQGKVYFRRDAASRGFQEVVDKEGTWYPRASDILMWDRTFA